MYDTVSHKYFYNKGTGNFIPAPRFVEYIEFDGAQYINTGITQQTCRVECGIEFINTGARQLMGFNAATAGYWGIRGGSNSYFEPGSGITAIKTYQYNNVIMNLDATDTTAPALTLTIIIIIGTSIVGPKINASTTYIIGGLKNSAGVISFNNSMKFYYNRFYNANGELIQHLRPCLMGNTPCMYDMVEGKYYMNSGTGTFGYGALKVNIDYTRIPAYIDGGMKWATAGDNSYSFLVPLTIGKNYKLVWENTNNPINGAINQIFRYGQTDIPTPQSQVLEPCVRTSPQATPVAEFTAVKKYLVVQVGGTVAPIIVENEYLKLYEMDG
jgi:hypothetical protein